MLGGVGNIGTMSARRRVIAAAGGGGGGGLGSRSGTADSDHVHTISGLNTLYMIPDIHYINQSANDNTENYSVKDILFTSGSSATHTFYFATKGALNTSTYNNDLCVGAIQIHTASEVVFAGGAENVSGIFYTPSDHVSNTDPTGLTFGAVGTSGSGAKWHVKSSTGSPGTGAADSIATTFQSTSNPLPNAAEENIAQAASTNFLYSEGTGLANNEFIYLKFSANLATNTAHRFVFAYNFGVSTSDTGDDKDDNVGLYIEN